MHCSEFRVGGLSVGLRVEECRVNNDFASGALCKKIDYDLGMAQTAARIYATHRTLESDCQVVTPGAYVIRVRFWDSFIEPY